jgi:hypothetical protein
MPRHFLPVARLAVAIALVLTAIPAAAAPIARYNWDRDEPFVRNRDYEGPGVYTQTLSITGLPAGTNFLSFEIEVNVGRETAWRFDTWGCPKPTRLVAHPIVADCDTMPGLDVLAYWSHPDDGATDNLSLLILMDPAFVPDPLKRYGLATITFDHELAETDCFGATSPLCFQILGLYRVGNTFDIVPEEHDRLTWNDSSAEPDCRPHREGFVPARPSSWGRVKSLYR